MLAFPPHCESFVPSTHWGVPHSWVEHPVGCCRGPGATDCAGQVVEWCGEVREATDAFLGSGGRQRQEPALHGAEAVRQGSGVGQRVQRWTGRKAASLSLAGLIGCSLVPSPLRQCAQCCLGACRCSGPWATTGTPPAGPHLPSGADTRVRLHEDVSAAAPLCVLAHRGLCRSFCTEEPPASGGRGDCHSLELLWGGQVKGRGSPSAPRPTDRVNTASDSRALCSCPRMRLL